MEARAKHFIERTRHWATSRPMMDVEVREDIEPSYSPETGDDYKLAWQITFIPRALHKAKLQLSVTVQGNPGVGVECWGRIAARTTFLCTERLKDRFVAGFEPQANVSFPAFFDLCEEISRGHFFVDAFGVFNKLRFCKIVDHGRRSQYLRDLSSCSNSLILNSLSTIGFARKERLIYSDWAAPEENGQQHRK